LKKPKRDLYKPPYLFSCTKIKTQDHTSRSVIETEIRGLAIKEKRREGGKKGAIFVICQKQDNNRATGLESVRKQVPLKSKKDKEGKRTVPREPCRQDGHIQYKKKQRWGDLNNPSPTHKRGSAENRGKDHRRQKKRHASGAPKRRREMGSLAQPTTQVEV